MSKESHKEWADRHKGYWHCDVCGRYFDEKEVLGQASVPVVPDDVSLLALHKNPGKELHELVACPECRALSHYERSKLRLMNRQLEKSPHGYWREVAEIQKSLESIANSLKDVS